MYALGLSIPQSTLTDHEFKLRDLFTIYASTPCHTHDLLGCRCSSGNANRSADRPNEVDMEDSDSDPDVQSGWVVASQVKLAKTDKAVSFLFIFGSESRLIT